MTYSQDFTDKLRAAVEYYGLSRQLRGEAHAHVLTNRELFEKKQDQSRALDALAGDLFDELGLSI